MSDAPAGGSTELGPQSPQATALAWVEAVMDHGDLAAAWPLTDATLRLVLAQEWVWAHRHDPAVGHLVDWDELAGDLAASAPDDPLWERFARDRVAEWHRVWKGFSARRWRVWDHPEVVGLDLEMVTFVEPSDAPLPTARRRRVGLERRFLLRHDSGRWLVAGVNGERRFRPGWPPTMEPEA